MPGASEIFHADLLAGRVVLVTGGGTNLGLHAAKELHRVGASVVIAGRRVDVLEEARPLIGERCTIAGGDIREPDGAAAIVAQAVADHGRIDALVNNAGGQYFVPAQDIAAKGWRAVWRLNVDGTRTMTEAVLADGFGHGGGTVVNVTVSPHRGYPGMAHTGAARAAVEELTREWATAGAERGVAVVAAAIGRFDTESLRKYPEIIWQGARATVPLQRLGTMDEYAWLVTMLCSPLGRDLSGSVVTLDGALDDWEGPWPRETMVDERGIVPTEERKG